MKNIEIELKYKIAYEKSDLFLQKLMDYFCLSHMEKKKMTAIYYDTSENDLLKNKIALRIRKEDKETVATVKSQGTYLNGIFSREEWNLNITGKEDLPIHEILLKMKCDGIIRNIVEGKEFKERMTTEFLREKAEISAGDCLIELAFDKGKIITANATEDLCELELELLEGSETCLEVFGKDLAARFNLKPDKMSKYARGLKLLGLNDMD